MVTTRLLIGSDVRLYSEGLRQFLGTQAGFEVVGTAVHAAAVLAEVRRWDPDVVLLDQALPGSLETLRGIRRISPSCRVVVLGVPDQEEAMLHWAEVGAVGLVPRDASLEDLVETIESAVRGELRCTATPAAKLVQALSSREPPAAGHAPRSPLTARESEIVQLIDEGLSNKEIAVRLGIEVATVKNHVHNLLEKLRVHRRFEAAARLRGKDPRRPTPQELFSSTDY